MILYANQTHVTTSKLITYFMGVDTDQSAISQSEGLAGIGTRMMIHDHLDAISQHHQNPSLEFYGIPNLEADRGEQVIDKHHVTPMNVGQYTIGEGKHTRGLLNSRIQPLQMIERFRVEGPHTEHIFVYPKQMVTHGNAPERLSTV